MYTLKLLARNAKIDEQIYLSTAGKGLKFCATYPSHRILRDYVVSLSGTKVKCTVQ